MERNEGVLTSDARQDNRWNPAASILQMGIREAICVPMQGRYDVVGVIYIDTSTSAQQVLQHGGATKFNEEHLKLMIAIAHQAALAVEDTRYYSAMVQAERLAAVGQTIATLSHHIKNILQGIRGGSYLIEMGLTDHDESMVGKGWKIVEKNQNKISALVMDMLTFSKEREPELSRGNINDVVGDVVELLSVRAGESDVELSWKPADAMPDMTFDPEGLHRAVLNVATNALDAATEAGHGGSRVEVRTRYLAEAALVQIEVEDNGPGIPADQMDHLFSPFVSSKKSRGTGLGLPVSRKILGEHGGRILVDSQPGHGGSFHAGVARRAGPGNRRDRCRAAGSGKVTVPFCPMGPMGLMGPMIHRRPPPQSAATTPRRSHRESRIASAARSRRQATRSATCASRATCSTTPPAPCWPCPSRATASRRP